MARNDRDSTFYECPCGEGEVEEAVYTPTTSYGSMSYSTTIHCSKCKGTWKVPLIRMKPNEGIVEISTGRKFVPSNVIRTDHNY